MRGCASRGRSSASASDPLIGLVPGLGDLIGAGVALWVVLEAADLGASGFVLLRMLLNVAIDTIGGAIPVAGDVFDALWRANLKNVRLLERHLAATGAIDKPPGDL